MGSWFSSRFRGFGRIALTAALAAALSACGQDGQEGQQAQDGQQTPAPPPAAAPSVASTPDAPAAVPDAPPLEFSFQYPGSVAESPGISNAGEFGKIYSTEDHPNLVKQYYRDVLADEGWSLMAEKDEGEFSMVIYTKGDQMATIFYAYREGGGTEATVAVAGGLVQKGTGFGPPGWSPQDDGS